MLRSTIRNIRRMRELKAAPKQPRHSDIYLVEFPKSGITWLSVMLANAALLESGRREIASYTNVGIYVPDIHVSRDIGDLAYDVPPSRFIKSHVRWNGTYYYVIYLVRNPLAVMKSYYQYLISRDQIPKMDFDKFCRSNSYGIPAWRAHVNSWLTGPDVQNRICLVRYEDLQRQAQTELSAIDKFFGWEMSGESIETAIARSDFESMKSNEEFCRSRNPRNPVEFIGSRFTGNETEDVVAYIKETCTRELELLGYHETALDMAPKSPSPARQMI